MSATATTHESVLRLALEGRMEIVPWTVDQYLWAVNHGVLPEDTGTELIDGFVVRRDRSAAGENPMTVGERHRMCVQRLYKLDPQFNRVGAFVQKEDPVALPPGQLPQPDIAIVRGDNEDVAGSPPGPADLVCVIEVSDSSLLRDTTVKLRAYAAAGVPGYVVVDLQHDVVLIHRNPRPDGTYPPPAELRRGDVLALPAGGANHVDIPVDRLL